MTTPEVTVSPLDPTQEAPSTLAELVRIINEAEWREFTAEEREDYPMVDSEDARIAKYNDFDLVMAGNMFAIVMESGLSIVYELAINQVDYS